MNAQELRIGNIVTDEWYDSFKNIITVDSINGKGIELFIDDDGNFTELAQTWIESEMPFDTLRGIPLTEEWLLKLGFENLINGFHKNISIDQELSINIKTFEIFVFRNDPIHGGTDFIGLNSIQHVHQLQNLYFALTGNELTLQGE